MMYALVVVILLAGPMPAKDARRAPAFHRVTFSIPFTDLPSCQEGQRVMEDYKEEVGTMAARLWLPRRLAPFVAEASCVAQPTLGL